MDLTLVREYSNQLLEKNKKLENIKLSRRKTLQSCTALLPTSDAIITKVTEQEANTKHNEKPNKRRKQRSPTLVVPPQNKYRIKTNIQTGSNQFKLTLTKLP